MANSPASTSEDPPPGRLALSWADLFLIALLVAAGVEAWRAGERLTALAFPQQPQPDSSLARTISQHERHLDRLKADIATLRSSRLRRDLDSAREKALLAAIERAYRGITDPKLQAQTIAPASIQTLYAETRLSLDSAAHAVTAIDAALAHAEAEVKAHTTALQFAQEQKERAASDEARRRSIAGAGISLALMAAVFALAAIVLPRASKPTAVAAVHRKAVLAIAGTGLVLVAVHLMIGAVASLTLLLLLVSVALARA
jgi:hypothetical protein